MNQTKSFHSEHARAIDSVGEVRAHTVSTNHEIRRLLACLWLAIAWIVGTLVFEVAAVGAEAKELSARATPQIRLGDALDKDETNVCLATSPLQALFRLENNEQLKSAINDIIETETQWLAQHASIKSIQFAFDDPSSDPEMSIDSPGSPASIAKARFEIPNKYSLSGVLGIQQVTHAGDLFAPIYIDAPTLPTRAKKNAGNRDTVAAAETFSFAESDDKDSNETAPTEQKIVQDPPPAASVLSTDEANIDAPRVQPSSPTPLKVKPASKTSRRPLRQMADAKIVRAKPISLIRPSPDSRDAEPKEASKAPPLPAKSFDELIAAEPPATAGKLDPMREPTAAPRSTARESITQDSRQAAAKVNVDAIPKVTSRPIAAAETLQPTQAKPDPIGEPASDPIVGMAATAGPPGQQPTAMEVPLAEPRTQQPRRSEPIRQPEEHIAASWPFTQPAGPTQGPPSVSLNVDNADVRTVFEMLARGYGMNILVSPDVVGVVTANVNGLTPDQALHGVLKMCNLRAQVEDDVIFVYPADKLPADARQLRLFPLDFARSEVLEPTVQGLLSPIGNAYTSVLDESDNLKTREAIVVVDTPESIQQIESYIYQVDQAPRQVMIEARVLEVELSDSIAHGIDFGALLKRDLEIGTSGLAGSLSSGDAVFFARIDGSDVNAIIELLETTTDAKTLASPKIMVVNGQQAKIQVGQQLGFTVATVTQTSTIQDVQFLDTGVVLSVKPTISRDNKVLMEVKPEVSNGQINPETLLPEEETRELETSVLLNNHQGMVIGGLIQENDRTVIKKLPWLGDIRHVGKFFQNRKSTRSRTEIIVALVPHIVNIDECLNHEQCDPEREVIEYDRAQTPLLEGPLQRACRPWEPKLPDTVGAERHYDVNKINRMIP